MSASGALIAAARRPPTGHGGAAAATKACVVATTAGKRAARSEWLAHVSLVAFHHSSPDRSCTHITQPPPSSSSSSGVSPIAAQPGTDGFAAQYSSTPTHALHASHCALIA